MGRGLGGVKSGKSFARQKHTLNIICTTTGWTATETLPGFPALSSRRWPCFHREYINASRTATALRKINYAGTAGPASLDLYFVQSADTPNFTVLSPEWFKYQALVFAAENYSLANGGLEEVDMADIPYPRPLPRPRP